MVKCPLCNDEFDSEELLENHMLSHDKLDEESHL